MIFPAPGTLHPFTFALLLYLCSSSRQLCNCLQSLSNNPGTNYTHHTSIILNCNDTFIIDDKAPFQLASISTDLVKKYKPIRHSKLQLTMIRYLDICVSYYLEGTATTKSIDDLVQIDIHSMQCTFYEEMLKALWGIWHIPYIPTCNNNALTYFFDISFELKYQAKVLQIGRNIWIQANRCHAYTFRHYSCSIM